MTRQEFIDDICDFGDLISFCGEYGYESFTENLYDEEARDSIIWENISDGNFNSWQELRDMLSNIDEDSYYWEYDGGFDFTSVSDYYFNDLKDDVLDALDRDGFFDEEEDEEETESSQYKDKVEEIMSFEMTASERRQKEIEEYVNSEDDIVYVDINGFLVNVEE